MALVWGQTDRLKDQTENLKKLGLKTKLCVERK